MPPGADGGADRERQGRHDRHGAGRAEHGERTEEGEEIAHVAVADRLDDRPVEAVRGVDAHERREPDHEQDAAEGEGRGAIGGHGPAVYGRRVSSAAVTTPSGRLAVALLAIGMCLATAWLIAVPGWGIVAALRPRIDASGRIGLAIVGSVAVSTHLVFWLSHLTGGYGRSVIFAAAVVLSLPILLAAWRGQLPPPLRSLASAPWSLVVAGLGMAVVGVTLSLGLWRVTGRGVISGGSNWGHLRVGPSL